MGASDVSPVRSAGDKLDWRAASEARVWGAVLWDRPLSLQDLLLSMGRSWQNQFTS